MKEEILRLRAAGLSYNAIVKELHCSKGTVAHHCGAGQKEKARLRSATKRRKDREWLYEYKATLACKVCNETRFWLLDFHHTGEDKKDKEISKMIRSASKQRVLDEIKKCDILCANCHRDLHYQEKL